MWELSVAMREKKGGTEQFYFVLNPGVEKMLQKWHKFEKSHFNQRPCRLKQDSICTSISAVNLVLVVFWLRFPFGFKPIELRTLTCCLNEASAYTGRERELTIFLRFVYASNLHFPPYWKRESLTFKQAYNLAELGLLVTGNVNYRNLVCYRVVPFSPAETRRHKWVFSPTTSFAWVTSMKKVSKFQ